MVLFHGQSKENHFDPRRAARSCHPNHFCILALEIKIRFRLHFAGLDKGHGGVF